ncbi:hypothetical protein LTR62_007312 [Meristemomyces frigidus]|uniref:NTF2-like domain-containing protein n=1 Tax=Meristemomyces frigidus TaxID=1508187 RepID=A0AAN7TI77_9PEZI|nr:hypothetical protein LTR62_007312 [Meristemomyces frigidus]
MRFAYVLPTLVALGACAALDTRQSESTNSCHKINCMDDDQALVVANNFASLVSAYTQADAEAVLSPTFSDYSDSVIALIDSGCPSGPVPLGVATFSSRAQFEQGQGGQPNITFNIQNVWHNCDTVTLRWKGPQPNPGPGAPSPQAPVTGIIVLETQFQGFNCPQPFLINTVYSEFNSAAWLYDLNVFMPNCSSSGPPPGSGTTSGNNTNS